MIKREYNGYIKLYFNLTDGDNNLFDEVKKESALMARTSIVKTDSKESPEADLFDDIAITNDDKLSFESALDDCFYGVATAVKSFGLDYKNLSQSIISMVQREVVDEVDVYAIYITDRGAVTTATLETLDDLLFRYIIYTLVQYTSGYMNGNKYLDVSGKIAMLFMPIEGLLYQATMQKPNKNRMYVYYGTLPIETEMSGAEIDSDESRIEERLKDLPDSISFEVPDGHYFYIAFPAEWGQYNFVSNTGREVIGTYFSNDVVVQIPTNDNTAYAEQICTVVKTDWEGVDVEDFKFKRIWV